MIESTTVRFSTFNASLNRNDSGQLITDLSTPNHPQAKNIAEIIQRSNPDVILLNEFDYDVNGAAINLFRQNYLEISQNGANAVEYPYVYLAPSNTGIASGFDLNNNGSVVSTPGAAGYGDDAFGFGNFPGHFAMVLLSKYPIVSDQVRTFQTFLWKDMPGNLLTDDPTINNPATAVNENLQGFYSPDEIEILRLSSKSHWDVPINVNGEIVHLLAAHPTPPVFDGPEDRNGKRNADEIRFWTDYVTPGKNGYVYDDNGNTGGLAAGAKFVIVGDYNADPFDGDSSFGAANQFFNTAAIQGSTTDISITPDSAGGPDAGSRQGGLNATSQGNPAFDTADFGPDTTVANLRVDYVLPSYNLAVENAGVFWPAQGEPFFNIVGEFDPSLDPNVFPSRTASSDHRLVFIDAKVSANGAAAQDRKTVTNVESLGVVSFSTGTIFNNTELGGLSGIAYDASQGLYYSISDDRSSINPARYYSLTINLSDGALDNGDVVFTNVTTVTDANGSPFAANTIDLEGIALAQDGTLYISSEGEARPDIPRVTNPFVNQFSLAGQQLSQLPVDSKFFAVDGVTQGIRNNLAFESLTISPDGRYLYTATENALAQDGTFATVDETSYSRIVKYDLTTGEVVAEYVYEVDEVAEAPNPANGFATNGLVELLAIDNNGTLLALERSFSVGNDNGGNTVKLYEILTQGALNVKDFDDLFREEPLEDDGEIIAPDRFSIDPSVRKRLLVDFEADLGIIPDNLEGLALGPILADSRQSLIVVSDNNFSATQSTQVIALALDIATIPAALPTVETPYTIDDENGTTPLIGDSDDPSVWINPENSGESIVIATLKDAGLVVFDLDGSIRQTITPQDILGTGAEYGDIRYNNVDVLYGFRLGNETIDIAVASDRQNDTLAIFKIDPVSRQLIDITSPELSAPGFTIFGVDDGEATAYGLAGYESLISGKFFAFATQADGNQIAQLELKADGATISAEVVRTLTLPLEAGEDPNDFDPADYQSEAIAVDQQLGIVYVGVEDKLGIIKFAAEPKVGDSISIVRAAGSPELKPDLEGLGIYYGPNGTGYLVASSQGDSSYAVYDRSGNNPYLGSFIIGDNQALGIDRANETDGLDIINVPLGSQFPFGAILVQDGANEPQTVVENDDELENISTNFKFVPWENVANAFDSPLIVDTEGYDPRNPASPPFFFPNGVASGDVDQDSAVLWTRVTTLGPVTFEYSTQADFSTIAGTTTVNATNAQLPVKVEISGLTSGANYFYRVTDSTGETAVGKFKTAAAENTQTGLIFGVTGDWRGEVTPYPAIRNIPGQNLDFFVALGDTVYADDTSPAVLNPDGTQKDQAETVAEFRAKHQEVYSQRFGANFWSEVRASTSILSTIDDHEVTNDFAGGADASSDDRFIETSGFINDTTLYENGLQVFQEYNPLENRFYDAPRNDLFDGERKLYRNNTFGSDAAVITLDTRSFRSENLAPPVNVTDPAQVAGVYQASLVTPGRTLLGDVQLAEFKQDLLAAEASGLTWKFVMIPEPIQNIFPGANTDAYEGFGKERAELLEFIDANITNVVFVAADIHLTSVNNLTYQKDITGEQIATSIFEITTGSVAYDAPTGNFLAQLLIAVSGNPAQTAAFYNSLPIAPDTDDLLNDRDDFVKAGLNQTFQGFPSPFDPIGLNNNLPQAEGLIQSELLQGDYFVSHSYSWSAFEIDPVSQQLMVTTYGIDGYTEEEVLANPEEVLSREPRILSQFTVQPKAVTAEAQLVNVGTPGNDVVIAGIDIDAKSNILFTGAGNDEVDLVPAVTTFAANNNRINLGTGDDLLFVNKGDRHFGGDGDDVLDATDSQGGNRLSGGVGNDDFYLGAGDRLLGGEGNDRFFVQAGGDNILAGGTGADQFWMLTDTLPSSPNTITDFTPGVDVIGIANQGASFNDLTLSGNSISLNGVSFATLIGIQTETLTADNFVFL